MKKIIDEGVYIELRGDSDLLIEGATGIDIYEDDRILLSLPEKRLDVRGNALRLRYLSDNKVGICGRIASVSYV